ncbi:MAG: LPS export ABC transporter periplasmic protein LptC [Candidatus Omnitrophota bacterium]
MILKISAAVFIFISTMLTFSYAGNNSVQESEQQINDFSLAGYGEKGKKTWELSGKSADIFDDVVKLDGVVGKLYGKDEDIDLTADKGDFDKTEGMVHLEQNVVITTSSGAKLSTDSLNWDRKKEIVATKDLVSIERANMVAVGSGARGEPNLNKVSLEKDVKLEIKPDGGEKQKEPQDNNKIVITCDGPLEIDYEKNIATFKNNVKVDREGSQIYSDNMDIYFIPGSDNEKNNQSPQDMGNSIDKIVARGNVKIVRGENISYCDEAVYTASDKKILLSGRPKLIIFSTQDLAVPSEN